MGMWFYHPATDLLFFFFFLLCTILSAIKKNYSPPIRHLNHSRKSQCGSCVSSTGSNGSPCHASWTLFKRGSLLMKSSLSALLIYRGLKSLKPARPCSRPFSMTAGSVVSKTVAWRTCSTLLLLCLCDWRLQPRKKWRRRGWTGSEGERGSVGVICGWIKLSEAEGGIREITSFPQFFTDCPHLLNRPHCRLRTRVTAGWVNFCCTLTPSRISALFLHQFRARKITEMIYIFCFMCLFRICRSPHCWVSV